MASCHAHTRTKKIVWLTAPACISGELPWCCSRHVICHHIAWSSMGLVACLPKETWGQDCGHTEQLWSWAQHCLSPKSVHWSLPAGPNTASLLERYQEHTEMSSCLPKLPGAGWAASVTFSLLKWASQWHQPICAAQLWALPEESWGRKATGSLGTLRSKVGSAGEHGRLSLAVSMCCPSFPPHITSERSPAALCIQGEDGTKTWHPWVALGGLLMSWGPNCSLCCSCAFHTLQRNQRQGHQHDQVAAGSAGPATTEDHKTAAKTKG